MGMFDTIIPLKSKPIKCPGCKETLTNFQTKDLENLMHGYEEGKTKQKIANLRLATKKEKGPYGFPIMVHDGTYRYEEHPKYVRFYAYDYCETCKKMVGQYFQFDSKGLLKRYKKPIAEE